MSRLIVVSNRVAAPRASGKPPAGGLAVALHSALKKYDGIWFGWSGEVVDATSSTVNQMKSGGVTYAMIDLGTEDFEFYYNGYANRTLWPLFHYRTDLTVYDRRFEQSYYRVNALFAHSLAPLVQPDDLIWIHDYHLIGCAEELRRCGLANRMGFFLHIPFPAVQLLLTLPNHESLVRSLFAYDVVGFQTETDIKSLRDYVVYEANGEALEDGRLRAFGRTIRAEAFPISIDVKDFRQTATQPVARRHELRIRESLGDRSLIIGVDRLDYTKGIPERLQAFERLLEAYPENRGMVSLLQIAPRSRDDVPEYADIRHELEAASGHVNGRFAEFDWVPIRYLNRSFSRAALAGLYRASRIGLVTPFRDGMNLVAKEFVAAQRADDPGILVLSRFAGAAQELDGALIVNPYDIDDVVDAIQRGLRAKVEERKERWQSMMEVLRHNDVFVWRDRFVSALVEAPLTEL